MGELSLPCLTTVLHKHAKPAFRTDTCSSLGLRAKFNYMKIIGLIGGIASGKSAVAMELAALGAIVLDADRTAHEVINQPAVQRLLVDRWGERVVNAKGQIDRGVVAEIVFSGTVFSETKTASSELAFLEQTLHPRIRERHQARLTELAEQGTAVAVIDAPLLLEAGWRELCDSILFVNSPLEARLQRASLRNWTPEEFAKREACQMPIAEKQRQSTYILANTGTLADLRDRVRDFWASLDAP